MVHSLAHKNSENSCTSYSIETCDIITPDTLKRMVRQNERYRRLRECGESVPTGSWHSWTTEQLH